LQLVVQQVRITQTWSSSRVKSYFHTQLFRTSTCCSTKENVAVLPPTCLVTSTVLYVFHTHTTKKTLPSVMLSLINLHTTTKETLHSVMLWLTNIQSFFHSQFNYNETAPNKISRCGKYWCKVNMASFPLCLIVKSMCLKTKTMRSFNSN
jgi:hypothetical protein